MPRIEVSVPRSDHAPLERLPFVGNEAEDRPISGRRAVDDGARLIIAENAIARVEKQYAVLAEGQEVVSSVLLGAMHKDGTTTPGLVSQVHDIREKQNESSDKIDAVIADMGDLKTAQAEQARTLEQHGTDLLEIKGWIRTAVGYLRKAVDTLWKGSLTLIGIGALHLVTLWWPGIVNFFSSMAPAADAATKHVH